MRCERGDARGPDIYFTLLTAGRSVGLQHHTGIDFTQPRWCCYHRLHTPVNNRLTDADW